MGNRQLKKETLQLLEAENIDQSLEKMRLAPARKIINAIFSFFYHPNELTKWRAVTAAGVVVSSLAEQEMESARVLMRRLIWNLNDESGGIGWGSPEAMGEITARSAPLAAEYSNMLLSYIRPDGNFLEHEMLQRGVLWGVGRLAHARPRCAEGAAPFLLPFLTSGDAIHRGLAAWALTAMGGAAAHPALIPSREDDARVVLYLHPDLKEYTVGQLARGEAGVVRGDSMGKV
ncbi:MAG: HEAT repeat domain-containing protein [Desulfobacterales bacterium]|nr:HEAT repeat domain-containing protein [Desulfobacterales bacterium]